MPWKRKVSKLLKDGLCPPGSPKELPVNHNSRGGSPKRPNALKGELGNQP
jgi:hypothetical protein